MMPRRETASPRQWLGFSVRDGSPAGTVNRARTGLMRHSKERPHRAARDRPTERSLKSKCSIRGSALGQRRARYASLVVAARLPFGLPG